MIGAIRRYIGKARHHQDQVSMNLELDSHADTCCFGAAHCLVLRQHEYQVEVNGFHPDLTPMHNVPVVQCVVAYDDPATFKTWYLIFDQVLYIKGLEYALICPNQLRLNGVTVRDVPKQFDPSPGAHTIQVDNVTLPLKLRGIMSTLPIRKPTLQEFNDSTEHDQLIMTASSPVWDPYSDIHEQVEGRVSIHPDEVQVSSATASTSTAAEWSPEVHEDFHRRISDTTILLDQHAATMTGARFSTACLSQVKVNGKQMEAMAQYRSINRVSTGPRKGAAGPERLSKQWFLPLDLAQDTINATTQRGVRDFTDVTGTKRLKPMNQQLRYKYLDVVMYTDFLIGPCPSVNRNTVSCVFSTDFGWNKAYPLPDKKSCGKALRLLHHEVGVPRELMSDGASEYIGEKSDFRKTGQIAGSHCTSVEPKTQKHNIAEAGIREIKRLYKKFKRKTNSPKAVWDHLASYAGLILSHSAKRNLATQGTVPQAKLLGDTPDISFLTEFAWYDWVWFIPGTGASTSKEGKEDHGNPEQDTMENRGLGRYLGPSESVGEAMTAKVLTAQGKVISRTTVLPLSPEDEASQGVKDRQKEWTETLRANLKHRHEPSTREEDNAMFPLSDDDQPGEYYADELNEALKAAPDAEDIDPNTFDKLLNAQVVLPRRDSQAVGRVIQRKRDADGNLIGIINHANPLMSTAMYEVEFADGTVEAVAANTIAENIYTQVDEDGHDVLSLEEIIDHEATEEAVPKEHGFYTDRNGQKKRVKTTKGWHMLFKFKDGTTSWFQLKDVKDDFMIQIAEYAVTAGIAEEPAFAWWVPYTIKKRDRIVKAQATRYARTTSKYGIEIPHSVDEAFALDKANGNTFWTDAIKKEMGVVEKAFKVLNKGAAKPVGYQQIKCHLVFDVKMDFTRKARFVAEGFRTDPPASITYASVVSRESVRIAFLLAALNDLDLLAADCEGAYLNAPCREKVFFEAGPELGDREGQYVILVRALYGLKSAGASWRATLANTLQYDLGFKPCKADQDVWLRPAVKDTGEKYYEYILVYTDDLLIISANPKVWADRIDNIYKLKKGSVKKPTTYLGADIGQHTFDDEPDRPKWTYSSNSYIKNALANVKKWMLTHRGTPLRTKNGPMNVDYKPELDSTPYASQEEADFFTTQIGVLQWANELGRIDIAAEVSMLASYRAAPRVGHVEALIHLWGWVMKHDRSKLVFDDALPKEAKDLRRYDGEEWGDFYGNVKEEEAPDTPEPRGRSVKQYVYSDSDGNGDVVTRKSRTGILMFVNKAPVDWVSKKQPRIAAGTFGSEFTALKFAVERVEAQRYKLRMMGVPIDGPAEIRCDNMSVVYNASRPESMLKKKSNSIAYHYVRERVAMGAVQVYFVRSEDNLADPMTKRQAGTKRKRLCSHFMY